MTRACAKQHAIEVTCHKSKRMRDLGREELTRALVQVGVEPVGGRE
jgi:hypothetical protein